MKTQLAMAACSLALLCGAASVPAAAQGRGWELGAVLDLAATSRPLALGQRDQGLALGHSDLVARGPLGVHFSAQLGAAEHTHDGKTEFELEEAWLQTRTLPGGLQARVGRFASQIGYLNEQHPHADDFVERPLLYRAFFGGHWFDDGLRLNWTAPTPFFLGLGMEVFRGKQLVREAASASSPGAVTLTAKLGADIGRSHSWQAGLSYLHNRREAALEEDHDHEGDAHEGHDEDHDEAGHDHDHAHGALYSGRKTWLLDFTWKWAPGGNNRLNQVRVHLEHARVSGLNRYATASDRHQAMALAVVWRFLPEWELGGRIDRLRVRIPHGDHFHGGRLDERALMLAWKPSHQQSLRLQVSQQRNAVGIEDASRRTVQLQYVLSFGAHGAHSF
jgi:hypothetical protein